MSVYISIDFFFLSMSRPSHLPIYPSIRSSVIPHPPIPSWLCLSFFIKKASLKKRKRTIKWVKYYFCICTKRGGGGVVTIYTSTHISFCFHFDQEKKLSCIWGEITAKLFQTILPYYYQTIHYCILSLVDWLPGYSHCFFSSDTQI